MFKIRKLSRCATIIAGLILAGCGTSGPIPEVAPAAPDANAVKIINRVKVEPTLITGGGMVYKLFVGERFDAEYNDKIGVLKLTDLENETTCSYDASGMLTVPEGAIKGYAEYCSHLSTNTAQYIAE